MHLVLRLARLTRMAAQGRPWRGMAAHAGYNTMTHHLQTQEAPGLWAAYLLQQIQAPETIITGVIKQVQ